MPGYRSIPSSDPVEQSLREKWYATEGLSREVIGLKLSKHIWDRTLVQVAEDRKRHPKAKRNAAVGSDLINGGGGRILP